MQYYVQMTRSIQHTRKAENCDLKGSDYFGKDLNVRTGKKVMLFSLKGDGE